MASDATKSHIFQQLFSVKIEAVFDEVGRNAQYQICQKNEKNRFAPTSRKSVFSVRDSLSVCLL